MYQCHQAGTLTVMKRMFSVLIVGTLLLSGCASQSPEDKYVTAVSDAAPTVLERGTATDLKELGAAICDALDSGQSAYDIADGLMEQSGWTLAESGVVVTRAAQILCPEHADAVN